MDSRSEFDANRLKTIKTVLLFLGPFLGVVALLRYSYSSNVTQASLDAILSAGILGTLLLIHYVPGLYTPLSRLSIVGAIVAFLSTLYNLHGSPEVLIWGVTLVLLSFLLRGRQEGWVWSLSMVVGTLLLVLEETDSLHRIELFPLITFLGNVFLVALFASWYEYLSETEIRRIQTEQNRLESLIRLRTRSLNEANAKAMKALKEAQDASRAKSTFLANVSHEIRTPLNAINGFISMMLKEENDTKKRKQLQTIHEASEILTQLISDILDLSKIESGNMELKYSNFDPQQLFFSVAELYQSRALEKSIDLAIDFCSHDESVEMLHTDPMRIRQVLNNLLSNAIKFTPEHGRVTVSACYREGWLTFTVRDNGIGMTPEDLERIFHPFQQAKNHTDGNIQGTGLGLTISREIAQRLGGKLDVQSAPGVGSTFTFSIPAQQARNRPASAESSEQTPPLPEKIDAHVLVVEDIRANQMFITMVLDRYRIRYDLANDGIEAVETYQSRPYDLILMDENMPRMNGLEATGVIREWERRHGKPAVPIIALTANAVAGDRERLLAAGMNEYISKPVNPDTLIRAIYTLLSEKS